MKVISIYPDKSRTYKCIRESKSCDKGVGHCKLVKGKKTNETL
ncbi:hypothetical protein [Caudoviricetes sp.]|nr:hypothetical protein [Caudoviricetes sp.]